MKDSHYSGKRKPELHKAAVRMAQENPGEWVKVGAFSNGMSLTIKSGKHASYPGPPGTWDAVTRKTGETRLDRTLYVRFMGEERVELIGKEL